MRKARPFRIALAASLLFNLLFVSALIGAIWRWQSGDPVGGQGRSFERLWAASETLQPENRRLYRDALQAVRRDAGDLIMTSRKARREAIEGLSAESFDRSATEAAMARARAADLALRTRIEDAVVTVAEQLPTAERARLVEGLRRSGPFQPAQKNSSCSAPGATDNPVWRVEPLKSESASSRQAEGNNSGQQAKSDCP